MVSGLGVSGLGVLGLGASGEGAEPLALGVGESLVVEGVSGLDGVC